jgi:hypothetical protein
MKFGEKLLVGLARTWRSTWGRRPWRLERRGRKELTRLGFSSSSLSIAKSGYPVESRQRRAVSRSAGTRPVAPGIVPGHPVRRPVNARPVPKSCSGQGSGAAPLHAPGWPVHRPVPPGISRKSRRKPPPPLTRLH